MSEKNNYVDLIEKIGVGEFRSRFTELMHSAEEFIEESGFEGTVFCSERILSQILLDYYSDIDRLMEFHNIEHVRTEKIFAYMVSWIIRRKPLQYKVDSLEEKDVFVNERFAAYLMLNECLCCGKEIVLPEHKKDLDEYINLLLYYFKYRECNPQAIELAISSFKMGINVGS